MLVRNSAFNTPTIFPVPLNERLNFTNSLRESCYSNASMQLMLSCTRANEVVQQMLELGMETAFNANEQNLLVQYARLIQWHDHPTGRAQCIDQFRAAVGEDYRKRTGQQSAEEFLTGLFHHPIMAAVQRLFAFRTIETSQCETCGLQSERSVENNLSITVTRPEEATGASFQEQLNNAGKMTRPMRCTHCNAGETQGEGVGHMLTSIFVTSEHHQYLWLVIPKHTTGEEGTCKGWLTGFDGNEEAYTLPFFPGVRWRVKGFLQHLGESRRAGHYIAWLKVNRNWILANCLEPSTIRYEFHGIRNLANVLFIFFEKL